MVVAVLEPVREKVITMSLPVVQGPVGVKFFRTNKLILMTSESEHL
jgi:hypothetical protein